MKNLTWKEYAVFVVLLIVIWLILKPSKEDKETNELLKEGKTAQNKKVSNAFSQTYFAEYCKKNKIQKPSDYLKKLGLPDDYLTVTAKAIYDAKRFFDDDEDALYNIFQQMKNNVVGSMVTFSFKKLYGKDLRSFLNEFLSAKEFDNINQILLNKK